MDEFGMGSALQLYYTLTHFSDHADLKLRTYQKATHPYIILVRPMSPDQQVVVPEGQQRQWRKDHVGRKLIRTESINATEELTRLGHWVLILEGP